MAFFIGVFNNTAVVGQFRYTQQTGLLVQNVGDLFDSVAIGFVQEGKDVWIDVTRTGTHHQTFQWRQAHGGIHTLTVQDARRRSTVTQVSNQNLAVVDVQIQHFANTLGYKTIAGTMSTVATQTVFAIVLVRHCIGVSFGGHGLVEGGVKHNCHWQLREVLACCQNTSHVSWGVQRCKVFTRCDTSQNFFSNDARLFERLATVNNAVTNCGNIILETFGFQQV